MSACAGCGAELPASKKRGRPRKWCSELCRKNATYGGQCIDCGVSTSYTGHGVEASERCPSCAKQALVLWPSVRIVEKIREWKRRYGEPPVATDWNPALARYHGLLRASLIAERYAAGDWPATSSVLNHFASWNEAIEAAGFVPLSSGKHRRLREVAT